VTSTSTQQSEKGAPPESEARAGEPAAPRRNRSLDAAAVAFGALAVVITAVWVGALVYFAVRVITGLL